MRGFLTAILALALLASPALGHGDQSKFDGKNPQAKLDMKRGWMSHDDEWMWGTLTTHHGFSNYFITRKGFLAFHAWRAGKAAKQGTYRVAVFKKPFGKITAQVFHFPPGADRGTGVGYGRAGRNDSNEVWFRVKRSKIGMANNTNLRWSGWGFWCKDDSCDDMGGDRVPNGKGSGKHFMPG